ncbi:hypothetical protein BL253_23780 [Pseudofrankia asymbiotica]|uniref:Uncharacterized protein n=1 Tax=Pseudofrankia asymbiotica TaxID=1834516 RepID=A0A1V2I6V6_9ACTN|nr:hypothetical protein BL253_23780 [Pseudofrankia asymbiotica]
MGGWAAGRPLAIGGAVGAGRENGGASEGGGIEGGGVTAGRCLGGTFQSSGAGCVGSGPRGAAAYGVAGSQPVRTRGGCTEDGSTTVVSGLDRLVAAPAGPPVGGGAVVGGGTGWVVTSEGAGSDGPGSRHAPLGGRGAVERSSRWNASSP